MKRSTIIHPNMLRNFFSPYYWVTLFALSFASGLFLLESYRVSVVETTMIVLPKTTTAVAAPANAALLLESISFGQNVQAAWKDQENKMLGFPDWSNEVRAVLLPESSIIALTVESESRLQGESLSRLTVKMLTDALSHWYNMATEIDFRIVDGPKTSQIVSNWPFFVLSSIGLSLIITTLFFFGLSLMEYWMTRKKAVPKPSSDYHISPETFRPSTTLSPYWSHEYTERQTIPPEEERVYSSSITDSPMEKVSDTQETSFQTAYQPIPMAVESVFQEVSPLPTSPDEHVVEETGSYDMPQGVATGKAPDNLPVMEDLTPLENAQARLVKADIDAFAEVQSIAAETELDRPVDPNTSETPVAPVTTEPTQEEYKRRLNELLSGRL